MTDKEKAEKYTEDYKTKDGRSLDYCDILKAYNDGLKEGKPKWHDLRKNPDDLPIYDKNVLVKYIIEDIECISISFCYGYNKWSQPLGLATDRDGYYYDYKILSWKEIE